MIADEMREKQEQLFASMMQTTLVAPQTSDADRAQFIRGFVSLAVDAAQGDFSTRDAYLSSVMPGIKRSGMPLGTIVAGMSGVAMGGLLVLSDEGRRWWVEFVHDYGNRLGDAWHHA